jgi:site-specific recombinase XerD
MDVVYLFYEADTIRIPFFDADRPLFSKFVATKVGSWDSSRHHFIVKSKLGDMLIDQVLAGKTYVEVDKPPYKSVVVGGFFNQSPQPRHAGGGEKLLPGAKTADLPGAEFRSLPEIFPDPWREKLEEEMRARKYSPKTVMAYIFYNQDLCRHLQKLPESITPEDIKNYLAHQNKTRNLSASTMNLALSAFKFFYSTILKHDIARNQRRPRQDSKLPVILSKEEIKATIGAKKNLKHRLLLMIAYSSGLRVSEVVSIKRSDIDLLRKTVLIRSGKGRKDRCVMISDKVVKLLREYYVLYDTKTWLFTGQTPDKNLSIRSAQKIFENALHEADIEKAASIHSLRHAFATHLLESGTDIRYIKELLGHKSIRTTERYTHVARRHVLRIPSPLDTPDD